MRRPITAGVRGSVYVALQTLRGWPLGRFVRQLQAWEHLPVAEFERLQRERLLATLRTAKAAVPLYAQGPWATARGDGIDRWPVLERSVLDQHDEALVAQPRGDATVTRRTSGSTGRRARIVLTRDAETWGWAHRYRGLLWHGLPIGVRALRLSHDRHLLRDWLLDQRSVHALESDAAVDRAIDILRRRRPPLVAGPPSALFYLARRLRERGIGQPLAPFARVGGEQLFGFQRDEIQSCLASRAIDSYGATELGAIAGECPAGSLHVYAEHLYLEVFDGDRRLGPGELGDLVATPLNNPAMPLVRYRVGDRARLAPDRCPCGLPQPVLRDLQARAADRVLRVDGSQAHASTLIERLGSLYADRALAFVRQMQLQQGEAAACVVLVESSRDVAESEHSVLQQRLAAIVREGVGEGCRVRVEYVPTLPRVAGKLRYYRRVAAPDVR